MNQKLKKILKEFYDSKKDDIAFIFLGGSACLSYITSAHDLDIYVVYNKVSSSKNRKEDREELIELREKLREIEPRVALIHQYVDVLNFWKTGTLNQECGINYVLPTYVYQTPNYEIICGEDVIDIKSLNIFDIRDRFVQSLKDFMSRIDFYYEKDKVIIKAIYHTLTGLYMLENNSYELTQEQIENINQAHDGNCTKELYDWVKEELEKL